MRIFIDDERMPAKGGKPWTIIRSWKEWIEFSEVLKTSKRKELPNHVSFDHDLGDTMFNMTGLDIAKDMIELDMDEELTFPKDFTWVVHSQNPVGAENIKMLLKGYFDFKKKGQGEVYKKIYKYIEANKYELIQAANNGGY